MRDEPVLLLFSLVFFFSFVPYVYNKENHQTRQWTNRLLRKSFCSYYHITTHSDVQRIKSIRIWNSQLDIFCNASSRLSLARSIRLKNDDMIRFRFRFRWLTTSKVLLIYILPWRCLFALFGSSPVFRLITDFTCQKLKTAKTRISIVLANR